MPGRDLPGSPKSPALMWPAVLSTSPWPTRTGDMSIGIVRNPYSPNVADHLVETAIHRQMTFRTVDLVTLVARIDGDGQAVVADRDGVVAVDSVAPYLVFGFPVAAHALRILARSAFLQNPVDAVLVADDKAATAVRLGAAGIAQVPTTVCSDELDQVRAAAARIGYPVVVKRTHGAQGRWVRRAENEPALVVAWHELMVEGPGALLVQPLVLRSLGTSIRVIVTGGVLLAAAERRSAGSEWRSNIVGGASQRPVELSESEHATVLAAATAVGLQHAGIDLLRTETGTVVLEVNSCPDFTSMLPYFTHDLTWAV